MKPDNPHETISTPEAEKAVKKRSKHFIDTEVKEIAAKIEEKAKLESKMMQAQASFYVDMIKSLQQIVGSLNEKADKPANFTATSSSIDYSKYSKAYQNFAQTNVSKHEGFDISVPVSDDYSRSVQALIYKKTK